jgi:hypothetical protein
MTDEVANPNTAVRIYRLTAAGALDTTFNGTGLVTWDSALEEHAGSLATDGTSIYSLQEAKPFFWEFQMIKMSTTGVIDPTFRSGGTTTFTPFNSGLPNSPAGLSVDRDGNLVFAVNSWVGGSDNQIAVAEMNATTGNMINSSIFNPGTTGDSPTDVVVTPDARVVVAGFNTILGARQMYVTELDNYDIKDWAVGTADWTTGTSAFGACLQTTGSIGTGQWTKGACAVGSSALFNPIPTTPTKVIYCITASCGVTAKLRFGLKSTATQRAGNYSAPVVFEAVDPNV